MLPTQRRQQSLATNKVCSRCDNMHAHQIITFGKGAEAFGGSSSAEVQAHRRQFKSVTHQLAPLPRCSSHAYRSKAKCAHLRQHRSKEAAADIIWHAFTDLG